MAAPLLSTDAQHPILPVTALTQAGWHLHDKVIISVGHKDVSFDMLCELLDFGWICKTCELQGNAQGSCGRKKKITNLSHERIPCRSKQKNLLHNDQVYLRSRDLRSWLPVVLVEVEV